VGWSDLITDVGITQSGAKTAYRALKTKEIAHITVERTDAGVTDPTVVQVWDSIDLVTENTMPLNEFIIPINQVSAGFTVSGVYSFALAIGVITGVPTDTHVATFRTRLDGGLKA